MKLKNIEQIDENSYEIYYKNSYGNTGFLHWCNVVNPNKKKNKQPK